jgi:hypothetical protein
MKKIFLLLLAMYIICTAFNNPQYLPGNYRDPYVGSYFCHRKCQLPNADHTALVIASDTVTIGVTEDATDSILDITIRGATYMTKLINKNLSPYPLSAHCGGRFFSSDSISFINSPTLSPNLCGYIGKKN